MDIKRPKSRQQMPPDAKKVFEGEIFDVYQWEQKMFDGSTGTFERLARQDGAFVIPVSQDGTIMLTQQEQPGLGKFISLPGGRVDEGEDPLSAAKRELREEAGLESDDWSFWFATQPIGKIDWAVFYFIAKNCKKVSDPAPDAGERITLKPVSLEVFFDIIVNDERFYGDKIKEYVLQAKLDSEKMNDLKNLFGV